jgi:catechol 2,3-dioxygenase-like lactoylglutathione lyase family enzyme
MAVQRMDNVGIVFEDLDGAVAFFEELGLALEGRQEVEGPWVDGVIGIEDARVEIAMLKTPDGHSRLELSRFIRPKANPNPAANAPVNTLGYLRVMFAVDDLDDTVARLEARGARLVDRIVQYEDMYRLCYVRGPEGVLVGLAEQLGGTGHPRKSPMK